jgi:ABC-type nickel/cobalt efflux system permease component RcnA
MDFVAPIVHHLLELHRQIQEAFAAALQSADGRAAATLSIAAMAFLLGMVHALTPGHGKAILFTYFLGREVRPWAGIAAAAQLASIHVGTAIVLVLLFGGTSTMLGRSSGAASVLEMVSAFAVAGAGCWYVWRALWPQRSVAAAHHHTGIAFAAGLLPCPLTIMVLSMAFAHASLGIGLVLVAVMGLGIMTTIATTGTVAIVIRRGLGGLRERLDSFAKLLRVMEIGSAVVILMIGVVSVLALTGTG